MDHQALPQGAAVPGGVRSSVELPVKPGPVSSPTLEDAPQLVIRQKKAAAGWVVGKRQRSCTWSTLRGCAGLRGPSTCWPHTGTLGRCAHPPIRTWTKVHKIKKTRFRMDSPGMMLRSRGIDSWGSWLGINI